MKYFNVDDTKQNAQEDTEDDQFIAVFAFFKTNSFTTNNVDYLEIPEILAKFGGIYGSIMLIKNFIFVRWLKKLFFKDIKKLEENKKKDDGLPKHIEDRVSYAGINSLFNRVERDGVQIKEHFEDIESRMEKMDEYDSLLGSHDAM